MDVIARSIVQCIVLYADEERDGGRVGKSERVRESRREEERERRKDRDLESGRA